jgi:CDP-paratose 2-epimerase
MNILLAGGCGFIGSNLSIYLKEKNFNILSIDSLSKKYCYLNEKRLKKNKIKNYRIDLKDEKSLNKIKFKPNLIIDCAAEPAVEVSSKNPNRVIENNFITTLNLLNLAKKNNAKIIFLSSSRVYPIQKSYEFFKLKKPKLFSELTPTDGVKTIYGFSKLASEQLIKEFSYAYKINFIINRLGLTSGPWQFGKVEQGLVSLWLWKHLNKKKLNYIGFNGTGVQIRDVLDIDDLCSIIYLQIKKIDKIFNETFCIGGGKKSFFNLKKLTYICQKITKNKIQINKIKKTSLYDIPYYISSNSKIYKFYKFKNKNDLDNTITKTFNWMKLNKKMLEKYF